MATVNNSGGPVDPSCGIQPSQKLLVQTLPDPRSLPGGQPAVRGRWRAAHLHWKVPPRDPREQHEHDRVEAHTIIHTRTPATRVRRMLREQRLNRLPQLVPHPPNRARHRTPPSPGLCHPERFAPQPPSPPPKVLRQLLRAKHGPPLAGRGAEAVRDAITNQITTLPEQFRRSLTWDQGAEMTQHAQLTIDSGLQVYFCDPQSPWQRGTNENTNGLLRQYFPKGTNLARHTAEDLAAVAATLNSRPRKTLDWRTPAEALDEYLSSKAATTSG